MPRWLRISLSQLAGPHRLGAGLAPRQGQGVCRGSRRVSVFDDKGAFYIAHLPHPLLKRSEQVVLGSGGPSRQEADPSNLVARLRLGGERRCEEADGSGNECPSLHHLTTLSARARTEGGIASRSIFAVFRLMASSNTVGRWIGRSAGLVPFS